MARRFGRTIRRMHSFEKAVDPQQDHWHEAQILVDEQGRAVLLRLWHNKELAGIWELPHKLSRKCYARLLAEGRLKEVLPRAEGGNIVYEVLKKKS